MVAQGISRDEGWLLLTCWTSTRLHPVEFRSAAQTLKPWVEALGADRVASGLRISDAHLRHGMAEEPVIQAVEPKPSFSAS